jgi:ketosteroid isomerase-like protein
MAKLIFSIFVVLMIAATSLPSLAQTRKPDGDNVAKVKALFVALEKRDITGIPELIDETASLVMPFTPSGKTDPEAMSRYNGKQAVLRYFNGVLANFKQIRFYDLELTESKDGNTIFVEVKSDFVGARNDAPYRNIYVLRFDFANGKIARVLEHANQVPAAEFFGYTLGKKC